MEFCKSCPSISEEDLQAARKELKTFVDVTDEDLLKIYVLAVRHARERRSTSVPVDMIMTRSVFYTSAQTDVRKAAGLLAVNHVSGMPVVDDDNKVVGVISEADIGVPDGGSRKASLVQRVLGTGGAGRAAGRLVGNVMSSPAITIRPDADIREAAAVLDMKGIKRLPVVDERGRLVGIVSRGDLVRSLGRKQGGDRG